MKKILKKTFVILLSVLLLSMLMAGFSLNASAFSPSLHDFGTWTGSGSVSVSINIDSSAALTLSKDGKNLDPSNYTKTGEGDTTGIKLNESYLKTLDNGEYTFFATFSGEALLTFIEDLAMETETEGQVPSIGGLEDLRLVKITYGDEVVDSANYTVDKTGPGTKIIFKTEYLETLSGEHTFKAHLAGDKNWAYIKLKVDVPDDSSAPPSSNTETSATPTSATPTSTSPENPIPKTGNGGFMAEWSVLLLSAAACFAVVLLLAANKKQRGVTRH